MKFPTNEEKERDYKRSEDWYRKNVRRLGQALKEVNDNLVENTENALGSQTAGFREQMELFSLRPNRILTKAPYNFTQLTGKSPSASVLRFNLIIEGYTEPSNAAAHHIVAGDAKEADIARGILKREGIDINEADNGVFLPKNNKYEDFPTLTHSTIHTSKYYKAVNDRLLNAKPGTVRETLHEIKQEILNGTFSK